MVHSLSESVQRAHSGYATPVGAEVNCPEQTGADVLVEASFEEPGKVLSESSRGVRSVVPGHEKWVSKV